MDKIDWAKEHILKIGNETVYDIANVKQLRDRIEPWLTAIFQSEHLSLLAGTGLVIATTKLASTPCQSMGRIEFNTFKEKIEAAADEQAKSFDRGEANVEDDFRAAIELYQGLLISDDTQAAVLRTEIDVNLFNFIKTVLKAERLPIV
ncbi:hypothetical protein HY768_01905 [candidate division TA06 bacterium]|uniref:Uncharacterized protein n=1 Tax=candidate division TA06 bacterium TaxID=2250710 RepID=A0A933MJH7_UNCT6|nr:hypothetical protein [candidate division TA06 bacterium]